MLPRVAIIVLAIAAAVVPLPPEAVERFYSATSYAWLQPAMTGASNLVPFALFDVACVLVGLWWVGSAVRDGFARRRWLPVAGRLVSRTALASAAIYLAFLASWGLNYRRVPLAEKLSLDPQAVSTEAIRALAVEAVNELNARYAESLGDRPEPSSAIDPRLAEAFNDAQETLGVRYRAGPARPKHTLFDPYFRAGGVQGMTAPFFLETLVPSDLLAVEWPAVVAHEWSHLAGFADESDAGFVAWLTCLRGSPGARYSGWLFLYAEATNALPPAERAAVSQGLGPGPRDDLRAIAERWHRNVSPAVSSAGWQVYDRYLRANRVEAGTASYGQVLQLVVGTELGRTRAGN